MRDEHVERASELLLAWYDRHAREMPWRVSPSERAAGKWPAPYRVWLSEVMLQQTTVAAVRDKFLHFTSRWPDVSALALAADADVMAAWAGLGYYARARNLLKCARIVANEMGGAFPQDRDSLLKLPGIGPYTAAAIAAIAFDRPETVVDGNVERVVARLFRIQTPLPAAKPELAETASRLTPALRPGDHAQAMMDLGATICTPKSPACTLCPLTGICGAYRSGCAGDLPRRAAKTAKPTRHGVAYIVRRTDGAWLLETRPPKGLLGGMLGWPCTEWNAAPTPAPPFEADWRILDGEVRHTFTHFHLKLVVAFARVEMATVPDRGSFHSRDSFRPAALPTVMRKAWELAVGSEATG